MLYIFWGQDDFTLKQAVEEIKRGKDNALLEANTSYLEGAKLTVEDLRRACHAFPLFASERLLLISGLLERFEHERGQPPVDGERVEALARVLEGIPQSTVVILIDGKVSEDNPLWHRLKPKAKVRAFPSRRGASLQSWIRERVAEGGGRISAPALRLLAEVVGGDLWALSNEIEKLLLLTQGRTIEVEDVQELVSSAREISIFRLVDGLLSGQPSAGQWLHKLLWEGKKPSYILTMLARQLRLLVETRDFLSRDVSSGEIQQRLGLADYAWRQTLAQARGYSQERLREIYEELLDTDVAIKTGRWGEELALDMLVAELCRG